MSALRGQIAEAYPDFYTSLVEAASPSTLADKAEAIAARLGMPDAIPNYARLEHRPVKALEYHSANCFSRSALADLATVDPSQRALIVAMKTYAGNGIAHVLNVVRGESEDENVLLNNYDDPRNATNGLFKVMVGEDIPLRFKEVMLQSAGEIGGVLYKRVEDRTELPVGDIFTAPDQPIISVSGTAASLFIDGVTTGKLGTIRDLLSAFRASNPPVVEETIQITPR